MLQSHNFIVLKKRSPDPRSVGIDACNINKLEDGTQATHNGCEMQSQGIRLWLFCALRQECGGIIVSAKMLHSPILRFQNAYPSIAERFAR